MDNHESWEEECEASEGEMSGVGFTGMFFMSVVLLTVAAIIFI
jgi:hypothetical protein